MTKTTDTSAKGGSNADRNNYSIVEYQPAVRRILSSLKDDRVFFTLLLDDYRSVDTVLVAFTEEELIIDRPVDWSAHNTTSLTVAFRDPLSRLASHFHVTVNGLTKDTIHTGLPVAIHQLQRRRHYRINAPLGSTLSFTHADLPQEGFPVKDLSVGGTLFCSKKNFTFEPPQILDIAISVPDFSRPIGPTGTPGFVSTIRQGTIVRKSKDRGNLFWFGVSFAPAVEEEEMLLQYVRQRELELLRKGVGRRG